MSTFQSFAQVAGDILDTFGVLVIVIGVFLSTALIVVTAFRHRRLHHTFKVYRQNLSRSILIGLEFLVAGDIIRTVAGDLTLEGVAILAIIVAIRLVLGMSLEAEIDGRWPWEKAPVSSKK